MFNLSFKEIESKHSEMLEAFCFSLLEDDAQAMIIKSETFLNLEEKFSDFSSEADIKSFLYTTARNSCINYLKYLRIINQ